MSICTVNFLFGQPCNECQYALLIFYLDSRAKYCVSTTIWLRKEIFRLRLYKINFQLSIFNLNRPNGRGVKQIPIGASRNPGCLSAKCEFPGFQRSEANLQPLKCSLDLLVTFASRQKYEVPFGSSQKQQALNED